MKLTKFLVLAISIPSFLSAEPLVVDTPLAVGSQTGSFDPKYTSIGIRLPGSDRRVWFENTVNGLKDGYYRPWQDIQISSSANRPTLTFDSRGEFLQPSDLRYDIVTEKLSLQNVILDPNDMRLFFQGQNNTLTFDNSDLNFSLGVPVFSSTSSVNFSFLSGDSKITSGLNTTYDSQWAINVQPGANATFRFVGTAGSSKITEAFRLYGPSSIDVDAGNLTFADSYFVQIDGNTRVTNGGGLNVMGAQTQVSLDNLSLETGGTLSIGLGGNTASVNDALVMDNGTVRLSSGTRLNVGKLSIAGNSEIIPTINNGGMLESRVEVDLLQAQGVQPARLTLSDIELMNVQAFLGSTNLTVDLDNSSLRVANQTGQSLFQPRGAEINVGDGSTLSVFGNQDPRRVAGTINVANRGRFVVGNRFGLVLRNSLDVNLQAGSSMVVLGGLEGSGSLGDGSLFIEQDVINNVKSIGYLAPGDINIQRPIGEIATNGFVRFSQSNLPSFDDNLVDTGLLDGGVYLVDISVAGGLPQNDKLRYGDGNVRLSTLGHISVHALDNPSALDLDGKEFTVVQADRAGVAGAILLQNQTVDIVEDGSIPALIDFTVVDRNTLGHDDVTLVATNRGLNHLSTLAPNSPNTQALLSGLGQTAQTAPNPPQTSSGTSLLTALNTLTNSQVQQMQFVHAEPYSSYLTVGLEQMDIVFDMVSRKASGCPGRRELASVVADQDLASALPLSTQGGTSAMGHPCRSWVNLGYSQGNVEGQNGLGNYGYTLSGLVGGVDLIDDPTHSLGVYLGFGTSALDEHDSVNHEITSHSFHLGAYGQYVLPSGWALDGALGYMYGRSESERVAPDVGAFRGGTATADFDSHGIYAGLSISRDFAVSTNTVLVPSFGMVYSHLRQEGFAESGARDLNFDVDAAEADALVASIGLDVSRHFQTTGGRTWSLDGMIRYHHDFFAAQDDKHEITVRSPLVGSVTQIGQNRGADGLSIGLGATAHLNENTTFGVGYAHTWDANGDENTLAANIVLTW
jgi:hypothetical protein